MVVIVGKDGRETSAETRDLRKGDVFFTQDGSGVGPLLVALADAELRPHPRRVGAQVWACASAFAGEFVQASEHS